MSRYFITSPECKMKYLYYKELKPPIDADCAHIVLRPLYPASDLATEQTLDKNIDASIAGMQPRSIAKLQGLH